MNKGFTLIELVVTIAIIAVLSGIILFTVTQYMNKGKDSNILGNLAVLIPAGEVWYNNNGNSYNDGIANFCDPNQNSVIKNTISQMPINSSGDCMTNVAGVCCKAGHQAWAACAKEFTNSSMAFCVDSRGMKKEINNSLCNLTGGLITNNLIQCPP